MSTPGEEIAAAVRRTLAEEAQRNEYHVSIVRVFAWFRFASPVLEATW